MPLRPGSGPTRELDELQARADWLVSEYEAGRLDDEQLARELEDVQSDVDAALADAEPPPAGEAWPPRLTVTTRFDTVRSKPTHETDGDFVRRMLRKAFHDK
jgi:hypothetical protein